MTKPIRIVQINIIGPVQSGKSAVLATIEKMLREYGYCVAVPDSEYRNNPAAPLHSAEPHELPQIGGTVFVLSETVTK